MQLFSGEVVKVWETKTKEKGSKGKKSGTKYHAKVLDEVSGDSVIFNSDEEIEVELEDEVSLKLEKAQQTLNKKK